MKLGTRGSVRSGYIRQNPTASTNLRASATVWTALPSIRQFAARCCSSSCSVILEMEVHGLLVCRRPALRPMQQSYDLNEVFLYTIHHDKRQPRKRQFSRSSDAPGAPKLGKFLQLRDRLINGTRNP